MRGRNGFVEVFVSFVERDDEASGDLLRLVPLQYDGETDVEQCARGGWVNKVAREIDDGERAFLDRDAVAWQADTLLELLLPEN